MSDHLSGIQEINEQSDIDDEVTLIFNKNIYE